MTPTATRAALPMPPTELWFLARDVQMLFMDTVKQLKGP
jgi:hypothetical protein